MTDYVLSNANTGWKFRSLLKARDFFFHDGKALRRVRVSVPVQLSAAATALSTLCWSVFATAQIATAEPAADVARMEQQVQAMQADVNAIKQQVQQRYQTTATEVRKLGIDPARVQDAVGGPFEAVQPLKTADPNFKSLFTSWKKLDQLEQGTISIPSLKPVKSTSASFTSGFGIRSDPFRGRAAMHGGIDLAGPVGTEIYATADGVVGRSGWNSGGYGNLVEIDHGKGIQTRYAHMSKLLVSAGQRVKRGQLVGLMGSTGRSTGSHLHYEVRIDGKAVNPIPFLQSSDYLVSVQARAAIASRTAQGGPGASK